MSAEHSLQTMKTSRCCLGVAVLALLLQCAGSQQLLFNQELSSRLQSSSCVLVVDVPQRAPELLLQAATSAMIHALSANCSLQLSPLTSGQKMWDSGTECAASKDCVFQPIPIADGNSNAQRVRYQVWDDLAMTEFYLNGAGLLWHWGQSSSLAGGSGCWAAASVLSYLMRPTEATATTIDSAAASMMGRFTCCYYGSRACRAVAESNVQVLDGSSVLEVDHHTKHPTCVFGSSWCGKHWDNLGAMAQRVVLQHVCARSSAVIGHLSGVSVKLTALLHFSRTGQMPKLLSIEGGNIWHDAWGFASCTSEELFKEQQHQAANGSRYQSEPPEVHGQPPSVVSPASQACGGCNNQGQCTPLAQLPAMPAPNKLPLLLFTGPHHHSPKPDFNNNCSVDTIMAQAPRAYNGSVCCGHSSSTGLVHIQRHPQLQGCSIMVLTYVGNGKNLLQQPATLQTDMSSGAGRVCHVAVLDPETARFHGLMPKTTSGLMQLGMWTVVTFVNSPYYQKDDPHWSPRRNLHLFKMIGFRLFPNAGYIVWVDGKLRLKQDPRLTVRATFLNGTSQNFAVVRHPGRTNAWQELAEEKKLEGHEARSKDHLANLDKVEELYTKYGMPKDASSGLLDSALLVLANTPATQKYFCLLWSLSHALTARDQVLFHFMMHRLDYARGRDWLELGPWGCLSNGITQMVDHLW